jgi:PAS domain S-box-containing protein/putative nucleotidyltransferase with HDIG domain
VLFDNVLDGILMLDYDGKVLNLNSVLARMFGLESVSEAIGRNALEFILPEFHSAVIEDLANVKEGRGGYLNSYKVRNASGTEFWVEGLGTDIIYRGEHIDLVAIRDITERKKAEEQLEHSFVDLAETVSRATASRDPYTAAHERRVAELARLVGEKMGLDKDRLMGLYIGGLLHDIGKISTPEAILSKPGKLSNEEWALVQSHARQGYEILDGANFPWPIADMTLHHHERLDGSGYPHGISGDEISLENRILGVCDVVEAMSSHRPYRPARSKEEVLEEIKGGRGTKYDVDVVDAILEIIENGEFDLGGE